MNAKQITSFEPTHLFRSSQIRCERMLFCPSLDLSLTKSSHCLFVVARCWTVVDREQSINRRGSNSIVLDSEQVSATRPDP